MKRIKYLGVLLSIVTLCVACEKSEKDGLGGLLKISGITSGNWRNDAK